MNTIKIYDREIKNKEFIAIESNKIINEFEKINGKYKNDKFIDKYKFRSFLKDYEINNLCQFSLKERSLIIKNFYKHFKMPFFDADFSNLDNNVHFIIDKTVPVILELDEIPKSDITKVIIEKLTLMINKHFSFKDDGEKTLIKQIGFRYIFENFLPELKLAPTNALFVK